MPRAARDRMRRFLARESFEFLVEAPEARGVAGHPGGSGLALYCSALARRPLVWRA
jgi:hypothetical protein